MSLYLSPVFGQSTVEGAVLHTLNALIPSLNVIFSRKKTARLSVRMSDEDPIEVSHMGPMPHLLHAFHVIAVGWPGSATHIHPELIFLPAPPLSGAQPGSLLLFRLLTPWNIT